MDSKTINILGIITVFIGLFVLMSLHVSHHALDSTTESEENHEELEESGQYYHIFLGFPISVLGAMLLILAEKQEKRK
ncbi:MAG: hypothetical protein ACP5NS_02395 [Candidatus Pacearchaeota archaeon]